MCARRSIAARQTKHINLGSNLFSLLILFIYYHIFLNKVIILSMRQGEIKIIPAPKKPKKCTWAESICGMLQDDSWDSLEEMKKYKKEDLKMEKRGLKI
jgi:hypothetical protein